jgi:hypothetical protein
MYCFLWGTNWIYICYVQKSRPPLWYSSRLQNGDVLCFLWGTNWIYICYVEKSRPLLWSSSRLQNGDVLCFLWGINWIYVCYAEESRPPLWFSGQGSWLNNGEYGCRDPLRWPRGNLYTQKLALISPTIGDRSVGIVRSRTQATEFLILLTPKTYEAIYSTMFQRTSTGLV